VGVLQRGAFADFAILSKSPFDTKKADDVTVESTYINGVCAWGCSRIDKDACELDR
jgi:predicted amidohydrolase YtcJ